MQSSDDKEQRRSLDREMLSIGGPALVGLAIDPLASLVDTAMIGRFCQPADLAGAGVAISVYNLASRTFNFLSSATTSQVAALMPVDGEAGVFDGGMSRAASSALAVAVSIGLCLAVLMTVGGGTMLSLLGVSSASEIRAPARRYLAVRALAFPASLSLMALEGAFRGARDTSTPLFSLSLASALNLLLDPILIIGLRGGVAGAALATAIAQYAAVIVLWRRMAARCGEACSTSELTILGLPKPSTGEMRSIAANGSWLTVRTFAGSSTLAFSSLTTAALGAAAGAAHQICFQLWLAVSLLADAVAVAAQALTASAIARQDGRTVRLLCQRTLTLGALGGACTATLLALAGGPLCAAFTTDAAVRAAAAAAWPVVAWTQPLNTLAFAVDGLLFGASDFRFCATLFVTAALPAIGLMSLATRATALGGAAAGLRYVWAGLGVFMAMRTLIGLARIASGSGPWQVLNDDR